MIFNPGVQILLQFFQHPVTLFPEREERRAAICSAIVTFDAVPYYHVITRCVRRAFLCGYDKLTGNNFSHGKGWFTRCLNEHIARLANQEDNCTARFWEGQFKSVALLDEKALLGCMAYVDLNPIRVRMAAAPDTSSYTSVRERIEKARSSSIPNHADSQPKMLYIGTI